MAELELTTQQKQVIESSGGAVLVSAAAGSGKTFVLVKRLLSMINNADDPASISQFLIITYTKAAAAELRAKITDEIKSEIAKAPQNKHLSRQLNLISGAKIMTVHSFCTSILRENAYLAGISPDFRVAEDNECDIWKQHALDDVLEHKYASIDEDPAFEALVENMSAGYSDKKLCQVILDAYDKVRTHADPNAWMDEQLKLMEELSKTDTVSPWEKEILDNCKRTAEFWAGRYEAAIDSMEGSEFEEKYLPIFANDLEQIQSFICGIEEGWDCARQSASFEFSALKAVRNVSDTELKDKLQKTRNDFKKAAKSLQTKLDVDRADISRDMQDQLLVITGLFDAVKAFDKQYALEKRKRSALDFGDLEHLSLELLISKDGSPTDTAKSIASRFREIMVDEYQDTNEIQDKIMSAVSTNGKNLFMVGDVKQSIYRFRLADPTIFLDKYMTYPEYSSAQKGESRKIILSQNFRSRSQVLDAANYVFGNIMSTEFGEMEYGDDERLNLGATYYPDSDQCDVEFDIIDMESAEDEELDRVTAEAAFTAGRIKQLLQTQKVYDSKLSSYRPMEPGDVVILMRSPTSRADTYIEQLKRLGIPCSFGGGKSGLLDTAEAKMLVALLEVIDNPHQDVPLIATLRSPLFGFTNDQLAMIRLAGKNTAFYDALILAAENDEKCKIFIDALSKLREESIHKTASELIWSIFETTNIIPVCLAMDGGALRRANLMLLYEYALGMESSGYKGLFSFVSRLRKLKEQGEMLQGAAETAEGNQVTIMSIHKSKGLEFPVVFLCDLSKRFNTSDLMNQVLMHKDLGAGVKIRDNARMIEYNSVMRNAIELRSKREMLSEELRVLYVAMTRAKEKLIMTASFQKAQRELERCCLDASSPVEPQLLLSSNSMAKWLMYVIMNLPEGRKLIGKDIGLPDSREHWDINLVTGGSSATLASGAAADADIKPVTKVKTERFDRVYPYQTSVTLPSKLTATYLKGRYLDSEAAERANNPWQPKVREFKRPSFVSESGLTATEKGTATHLVMQYIDFDQCGSLQGVKEQIAELRRAQIISNAQAEAVDPEVIYSFFVSDIGRRMEASQKVTRELKFSILAPAERFIPDGGQEELMLQGVIDCYFEENGEIVLIDFKTDNIRNSSESQRAASYAVQMDIYGYALERMTGMKVKEKILYFFATNSGIKV